MTSANEHSYRDAEQLNDSYSLLYSVNELHNT